MENEKDLIKNLFRGNFKDTPEQNSTSVRLFLSSQTSGLYILNGHISFKNIFSLFKARLDTLHQNFSNITLMLFPNQKCETVC